MKYNTTRGFMQTTKYIYALRWHKEKKKKTESHTSNQLATNTLTIRSKWWQMWRVISDRYSQKELRRVIHVRNLRVRKPNEQWKKKHTHILCAEIKTKQTFRNGHAPRFENILFCAVKMSFVSDRNVFGAKCRISIRLQINLPSEETKNVCFVAKFLVMPEY